MPAYLIGRRTEREAAKQPYSKSHAKRLKQKQKSALTADLQEVDQILDQVELPVSAIVANEMTIGQAAEEKALGKRNRKPQVDESTLALAQAEKKEKLTAKKRQKVLSVSFGFLSLDKADCDVVGRKLKLDYRSCSIIKSSRLILLYVLLIPV